LLLLYVYPFSSPLPGIVGLTAFAGKDKIMSGGLHICRSMNILANPADINSRHCAR
jgi:hypothetical protein